MSVRPKSLVALTIACAVAAAIFGFGSEIFAFRYTLSDDAGRAELIILTRIVVFISFGILLAFRGGWWGVGAGIAMAVGATLIEWALFPLAYDLAVAQADSVPRSAPNSVARPSYLTWSLEDIFAVGLCAALAQGLRLFSGLSPRARPDE